MQTALIVGASRGLGRALAEAYLARGWQVVATVRGEGSPLRELASHRNGQLEIETVDINVPDQVQALRVRLQNRKFDLLFVNAGVKNDDRETIADVTTEEFVRVLVTNALSPMRFIEAFEQLVTPDGTIAVMSSGLGSVTNNLSGGYEVYRASKASLNTLMRSFAARHASGSRSLLVLAPGWVRTDMGGPEATLTVDQSIPNLVATVEAQRGKAGLQYLNYQGLTIPW